MIAEGEKDSSFLYNLATIMAALSCHCSAWGTMFYTMKFYYTMRLSSQGRFEASMEIMRGETWGGWFANNMGVLSIWGAFLWLGSCAVFLAFEKLDFYVACMVWASLATLAVSMVGAVTLMRWEYSTAANEPASEAEA
mmetsp:Transcript_57301/g.114833  ORF Transcript_57301/g.114833 Transcript_57301/m.114833 type:complete len:138 (-) Transcript_57301:140-553(-)